MEHFFCLVAMGKNLLQWKYHTIYLALNYKGKYPSYNSIKILIHFHDY